MTQSNCSHWLKSTQMRQVNKWLKSVDCLFKANGKKCSFIILLNQSTALSGWIFFNEESIIKINSYLASVASVGSSVKSRVMNASVSTHLRGLVGMELSLGSRFLQLLLQSPALCPPLAYSLLGPGLQFISGPGALLD